MCPDIQQYVHQIYLTNGWEGHRQIPNTLSLTHNRRTSAEIQASTTRSSGPDRCCRWCATPPVPPSMRRPAGRRWPRRHASAATDRWTPAATPAARRPRTRARSARSGSAPVRPRSPATTARTAWSRPAERERPAPSSRRAASRRWRRGSRDCWRAHRTWRRTSRACWWSWRKWTPGPGCRTSGRCSSPGWWAWAPAADRPGRRQRRRRVGRRTGARRRNGIIILSRHYEQIHFNFETLFYIVFIQSCPHYIFKCFYALFSFLL